MRAIIFSILIAGVCISSASRAKELTSNNCSANLVFDTTVGKRTKIMLQTFSGGQWSEPELVFESAKELGFNPVIASDKRSNKLVVWPSFEKGTTKIKYRVKLSDGSWDSDASYVVTNSGENTTPTVLSNLENDIWLAWASDTNGLDDIFIARWNNGIWSKPKQVNKPNDIPDITPQLNRLDGNIVLTWRRYDRSAKNYIEQSKIISSYKLPTENSESLSDYCSAANYQSDVFKSAANRLYLDKTKVISNHSKVIEVR